MTDFDNLFDAALFDADTRIIESMGKSVLAVIDGVIMPFRAVFDDPAADVQLPRQGGGDIEDVAPRLFAKTAAIAGLKRKDVVTVAGENYWVVKIGPDDTGTCVVTLARGTPGRDAKPITGWSKKHGT